jgi:RNA polymerase sigma factor (sigma-70 family)
MKPSEVERLYVLVGHRVFQKCFYLLREEQAAMDVMQDVFATLLDRFIGFPDDRRATAWLLRVATNKSFNELRRQRYWKTNPFVEGVNEPVSSNPFPELEDRLAVEKILLGLNPKKAAIVAGYFLEGLTLEETAAENDCSLPTVRRVIAAFLERARAIQQTRSGGQS